MNPTEILGLAAAAFTTFAFLPQVLQLIKTKSVDDISLSMYLVFITGLILWLIYGFIIGNIPIICANIITISLTATIIFLKLKYGRQTPQSKSHKNKI
jgi:MtN3 and saliva related transmembrane protein